jgi:hypothetical protein
MQIHKKPHACDIPRFNPMHMTQSSIHMRHLCEWGFPIHTRRVNMNGKLAIYKGHMNGIGRVNVNGIRHSYFAKLKNKKNTWKRQVSGGRDRWSWGIEQGQRCVKKAILYCVAVFFW